MDHRFKIKFILSKIVELPKAMAYSTRGLLLPFFMNRILISFHIYFKKYLEKNVFENI